MQGDAEIAAKQGLGGCGTEADDYVGADGCDFGVEPGAARGDFGGVWFFVDAAFATWFPFEVLHDVGDVDFLSVDTCFE